MSKTVAFKQPAVRPNPDMWVEARKTAEETVSEAPVAEMPKVVESIPAPAPVPAVVPPMATPALPTESVPLPVAKAPQVLLERAVTRMSVSLDEALHLRLKVLCARRRSGLGDFIARAVEEAVVKAEQELA